MIKPPPLMKESFICLNYLQKIDYRDTAWIFIGGLAPQLTEGDIICCFSQFGEIEDLHLIRDEATGQSKGFAFVKYEDWNSTVLTIDNFDGVELCGYRLRLDHSRYERSNKKRKDNPNNNNKSGGKYSNNNNKRNDAPLTIQERLHENRPGHAYHKKEVLGGERGNFS